MHAVATRWKICDCKLRMHEENMETHTTEEIGWMEDVRDYCSDERKIHFMP